MSDSYRVIISTAALTQLGRILDYIAQDSPANAVRVIDSLLAEIESLERFPGRHAEVETEEGLLRRMPCPPFRIFYEINRSQRTVRVVAVQHGAQRS
jgi:plasmid stabilization system protein ParE